MTYFTADFILFFQELAANNNRDWFNDNKKRYEKSVKKPFAEFVKALIEAAQKIDERIDIEPKQAIFRIYRDIRFSKDKTPYKIFASAMVAPGGRKSMDIPAGFYLEAHPEHLRLYNGLYRVSKDNLQKVRTAIIEQPKRFEALINDKAFKQHFGEIQGEKNKRIPKEFKAAAETQPLIVNKQFYYYTSFDIDTLLEEDVIEKIMKAYQVSKPLSEFFEEAIVG